MNPTTDTAPIFAPLWKRKWLILLVGVLVGVGTYFYYKHQRPTFASSTTLYIGAGSEEAGLINGTRLKAVSSSTQTALINSVISEAAHKQLRAEGNVAAAKGKVKAKAPEKSLFITLTAEAHTPTAAAQLVNLTAQTYIARQRRSFESAIKKALAIARAQLHRVEAAQAGGANRKGAPSNSSVVQAAALSSKVNQLEAELSVKGVQQLAPAKPQNALLVAPKPRKNAIFGFALGLVLASVAAYLLDRLDRRLRSLEDVEDALGFTILTALPAVQRPIVVRDGRRRPSKPLLEPLRRLHTTLELDPGGEQLPAPRTILFVSGEPGDGKSSLVANLARVQCDSGKRVAVIEADFRRPVQARLLQVEGPHGLADVLEGNLTVHEAMQRVETASTEAGVEAHRGAAAPVATVVKSPSVGSLSVLVAGRAVDNPPALLARAEMRDLLSIVAEDFDYVLVDAPPPLEVSDVMPLLRIVDGIVVVARVGHTREASAHRLAELLLRGSEARVLGTVANSVPQKDLERYGFTGAYTQRPGLIGR